MFTATQKAILIFCVVLGCSLSSLSGCSKVKRLKAGNSIYGAFATGILSGVLISLQPGIGSTPDPGNPMEPLPKATAFETPSQYAQALQTWLDRPANFCSKASDEVDVFLFKGEKTRVGQCLNFVNDGIVSNPNADPNLFGNTLLRGFYLCQYEGMDPAPWLSLFQLMHFESDQDCEDFKANQSLADDKQILVTYGGGRNGHQQNRFFSSEGNVQLVYSDFVSGWNEAKSGGVRVTYSNGLPATMTIEGVQIKNYSQTIENLKKPRELFKDLEESQFDELELKDDLTFSSIARERRSSFSISYSGLRPRVTSGEVEIQDNQEQALMSTRISSPLNYSDPTCCWPLGGQVTTTSLGVRNFREDLSFSTRTCGEATLMRTSGGKIEKAVYQLDQCF